MSDVKERVKRIEAVQKGKDIVGLFKSYEPLFAKKFLGLDIAKFHEEWFEALKNHKKVLLIAPRGHSKTTMISIVYPVIRILKDLNIRMMVVSNTSGQSTEIGGAIRQTFERDDFKEMFGDFTSQRVWTDSYFKVSGRTRTLKEPTFTAGSVGGAIISKHVDLLICDDIIDEENSRTETQRRIVDTWFTKTLLPVLESEGQMVVVGTRWHYDDLYGKLMKKKGWKVIHLGTPENPEYDDDGKLSGGNAIWEKYWSMEKLIEKYEDMGRISYNCAYMNDPSGLKGRIIEWDWIQWFDKVPVGLRYYMAVDPAASEDGDYFVILIVGVDERGNYYVVDMYRQKTHIQQQIEKISEYYARYRPLVVGIEAVAYQLVLARHMEMMGLPVKELQPKKDKVTRVLGVQPYFQNRKVFIRRGYEDTIGNELVQFPAGKHDDTVDALVYAIDISFGGTMAIQNWGAKDRESTSCEFFDLGDRVDNGIII